GPCRGPGRRAGPLRVGGSGPGAASSCALTDLLPTLGGDTGATTPPRHTHTPFFSAARRPGPAGRDRAETDPLRMVADGHRDGLLAGGDRKSTRLNSSHVKISYAVFC